MAGQGLISSQDHQETISVSVSVSVSDYQREVRAQGLWMSFSQPTPLNTDRFSKLEALMAQDAPVTGTKIEFNFIILNVLVQVVPVTTGQVLTTGCLTGQFSQFPRGAARSSSASRETTSSGSPPGGTNCQLHLSKTDSCLTEGPQTAILLPVLWSFILRLNQRSSLSSLTRAWRRLSLMDSPLPCQACTMGWSLKKFRIGFSSKARELDLASGGT